MEYAVVVLASYRVTRLITTDDLPPIERARAFFVDRWGPWGGGLVCHWCIGSIVAFAFVAGLAQIRDISLPALWALATAAGVGIVGDFVE